MRKFLWVITMISSCLGAATVDPDGELDRSAAKALKRRLEEIEAEASSLVGAIYSESSKFVAHLYLDVIEPLR